MEITKTKIGVKHKLRNKLKLESSYMVKTETKSENRKYNEKNMKLTENVTEKKSKTTNARVG